MKLEQKLLLARLYNKLSWYMCMGKSEQDKLKLNLDENTTMKELLDQIEPLYLESIGKDQPQEEEQEIVETPIIVEVPMSAFELLSL